MELASQRSFEALKVDMDIPFPNLNWSFLPLPLPEPDSVLRDR